MRCLVVFLVLLFAIPGFLSNCPPAQPPQWGSVRERVLSDGSLRVLYSCEPGRRIKGRKLVTCTEGIWDHPAPKCVPVENTARNFRVDLFVGDQPIIPRDSEEQTANGRLKVHEKITNETSKKHRKMKEGKKKKKRRRKKPTQEKTLSKISGATLLNETMVSRLDISCFTKTFEKGIVKAPSIEHAHPAKYARRKNVLPPFNRYLVAIYECTDSYVFVDSTTDRLFCSNGTWLGRRPKCVSEGSKLTVEKVKHCDQDGGECEHLCEDTPTGIKCTCFRGFRATESSCIDGIMRL